MRKVTLHNWGNNETYRKNEDSEGNSNPLIQEQVAGSNTGQYIKSNQKERKEESDYRYTWPDTIQRKWSVWHSNGMDLVA